MSACGGLEVITIGRIGVDVYPEQTGVGLEDVDTFVKSLGGTATNVAVAAARLGRRAAVVTGVGDDPFGRYCLRRLAEFGVDTRFVITDPRHATPVTFAEVRPPEEFPLFFYRQPTAPDLQIRAGEELGELAGAPLLWTTGTGFSREPSRSTLLRVLEARGRRPLTVHDLDWRPMLWPDGEDPRHWAAEAVRRSSVVVGNRAEAALVTGDRPPPDAARMLLDLGASIAVVKLGPDGVLGATAEQTVLVPPLRTEVVNGLGAGDAFGGALCHGLLAGWDLETTLRAANAAGAHVAARLLCSDAMPSRADIELALGEELPGA
jgi:5-dehydro-2-deoxygluconokinase